MPARSASRPLPVIPTASMADVAFLLLLFFLVTTAIHTEAGLPVVLPPAGARGTVGVPTLLTVVVGPGGDVLVDGEPVRAGQLRAAVAGFASARGEPRVALQASCRTPYDAYVAALDAVLLGHRDAGIPPRLTLHEPAR